MTGTVLGTFYKKVSYGSSSNSINCDFVFCGALYYWSSEEEK